MPTEVTSQSMMPMRKILVATDLSEPGDLAIREAGVWAKRHGAELVLLHVLPQSLASESRFASLSPNDPSGALADVVQRAQAALEEKARQSADKRFSAQIEVGEPYAAIVRAAEAAQVDLVVVGYRGSAGLAQVVLGSTAERVVRYASCPVLIVRPTLARGEVVAATDFSDGALPAVHLAASEARVRKARLTLFHALPPVPLPVAGMDWAGSALSSEVAGAVASALERRMSEARDHLSALQSKLALTGDVEVVPGPAAEALLRFIEARRPDLVVVGTHGRTGLRRLVLGSVAEKVVRASPSSVLVTRLRPAPA